MDEQGIQRKVAVLCQGTEVYGVATVIQLMARTLPDLLFVCMQPGPLSEWLQKQGARVEVVNRPALFVASPGSVQTLLRLPGAMHTCRKTAVFLEGFL
ncbi:MAG: hypothetical protein AAF986_07780, partial [Pseudomonadota bacterium]